uniref:DUF1985 domain-containing protein n=1 Tax=Lactuca sativa TaxID=4236 RepID=A0A9R1VCU6_LACSA|nr:hypothetical protein LSAT_V11C500243220 [Lactuca sativa]
MKAIVNLKGSDGNIWEVFEVLDDVRRAIFRDTVFGYFMDVPRLQGDALLFHKMFLHQIRPDPVLSPDGIKRLYFRVGNTKMVYGPEEFCLITGFNFGECLLRERLFPDPTNSSVKIGDLKRLILSRTFLEVDDVDAVRVCLIYILCEEFGSLDHVYFVYVKSFILLNFAWGSYLWDFTYVDLEDTWSKINNYLSLPERRQTLKYSVSGFTARIRMIPVVRACGCVLRKNKDMPRMKRWSGTKKLKWVDVNKIFSKIQELTPRQNMSPSDGEMTSCYYMSFQEYVYDEGKPYGTILGDKTNLRLVCRPVVALIVEWETQPRRGVETATCTGAACVYELTTYGVNTKQFWNDITFDDPIVSQRKYDEHVVQDEVMNKNNTTENIFGDIEDDKVLEERNDYAGNKFDDDMFDVNDYSEVKEVLILTLIYILFLVD